MVINSKKRFIRYICRYDMILAGSSNNGNWMSRKLPYSSFSESNCSRKPAQVHRHSASRRNTALNEWGRFLLPRRSTNYLKGAVNPRDTSLNDLSGLRLSAKTSHRNSRPCCNGTSVTRPCCRWAPSIRSDANLSAKPQAPTGAFLLSKGNP